LGRLVDGGDEKMRNKRGQIFAGLLVLITLFMCGMVWVLYNAQQGNAASSLVSPRAVLEMRDDLEIFEIREEALIESLAREIGGEFGSDKFIVEFREKFLDEAWGNEKMREFIVEDLVISGHDFEEDAKREGVAFLNDTLYSDVVNVDGKMVFSRRAIGKKVLLRASDRSKTNFPVGFVYEFGEKEFIVGEVV